MRSVIRELILEFHNRELPDPSLRNLKFPHIPQNVGKAVVLCGMRRTGKTWLLYNHIQNLIKDGYLIKELLYLNFEDDRLNGFTIKDFQLILDVYFELYPDMIGSNRLHLYFDEIHEVDGWEKFIRRLIDSEKVNIYITGSSAKQLSKEIASNLRGRTITREVFPFSFNEYLNFKNVSIKKNATAKDISLLLHYQKKYFDYGGFPEIQHYEENEIKRDIIQSYIDTVIYRDIIERYNLSNASLIKELLLFCIRNSASAVSINKLYNRFRSMGRSVGKDTLYSYLAYFEDAYAVFTVPIYAHSMAKQNVNPKKIYAVDHGLITASTVKLQFEKAAILETAVFSHIRRTGVDIFYYRTATGKEVDFLTVSSDNVINLIQVSVDMEHESTRNREVEAMREAMQETGVSATIIVTEMTSEELEVEEGRISLIPFWEWAVI